MELFERIKDIFKVSKKNSDVINLLSDLFLNVERISSTVFLYLCF